MALPAVKHFDPVIGIDVHTVVIPSAPAPVPIPHPHVGFVLDLRECLNSVVSVIGSIVFSFVSEVAEDIMEDNPELVAEGMALVGKVGGVIDAVSNNPVVKTGLAIKNAKDQLSSLKDGIVDKLGGNIGTGGGSNRPVKINGTLRATVGTHTFHIPGLHFPLGTAFAPLIPRKDSESFMGSKTVMANSDPLSYMALPAMSCWFVGLPSPDKNKAHTQRNGTSLPTSVMLPIPMGRPVVVGGMPVLNLIALLKGLFTAFRGSKLAKDLAKKLNLESGFLKCQILDAEPVNSITGAVVVEQNDFVVKGRFPLVWDRYYNSQKNSVGAIGQHWQCPADIRLEILVDQGELGVVARFPDHETVFSLMPIEPGWGERVYDWQQGHALYRSGNQLILRTRRDEEYFFMLPDDWENTVIPFTAEDRLTLPIQKIADLYGSGWQFKRHSSQQLLALVELAPGGFSGREIHIIQDENAPFGGMLNDLVLVNKASQEQRFLIGYRHDGQGDLIAVLDADGNPYQFAYIPESQMVRHTDRNGLSFYYSYQRDSDGLNRVEHAWGDDGLFDYHFHYDRVYQETRITDSLGHTTLLRYDERQLPFARVTPLGGVYSYQYDEQCRTIAEIDPMGNTRGWVYDQYANLIEETFADRSSVKTRYNDDHKPVCITDPGGRFWRQTWDAQGNVLSQTTPGNISTHFTYNDLGQLVAVVDANQQRTELNYDALGFLQAITDARSNTTLFEHDFSGKLLKKVAANGDTTCYQYDNKQRLISCLLPDERQITCEYDRENNLLLYGENGTRFTRLAYFGQGRLKTRIEPDGSQIDYLYDTEEQLIGVKNQRGEVWQLKRNAEGRLIEEVDYWGQSRRYQYDAVGHLTGSSDPLGQMLAVTCDKLGRITEKRIEGDEQAWERYSYNKQGQLTEAVNRDVRVTRRYNKDGQLEQEIQAQRQVCSTVSYGYNSAGQQVEQRHLLQHEDELDITLQQRLRYGYDALGQCISQQIDEHAPMQFSYDSVGRLTEQRLTQSLSHHLSYTAAGQLACYQTQRKGLAWSETEYYYDDQGNLTQRQDSRQGVERYHYDVLGQIVGYQDPLGALHRYRYDACGDRFSTVAENAQGRHTRHENGTTYQLDKMGQLVARTDRFSRLSLSWDKFGRLSGLNNEHHDHAYIYDALGRRVGKRHYQRPTKLLDGLRVIDKDTASRGEPVLQDETWFVWDGDAMVGELRRDVVPPEITPETWDRPDRIVYSGHFYVYQPGSFEPRAMQRFQQSAAVACQEDEDAQPLSEEQLYFYQNDPNGMPIRLQNDEGEVVWEAQFTPFGQLSVTGTSQLRQPLRMQGQYYDVESGLHYNRYRYYDPACGVFISQDPIGLLGGINPYRFALNTLMWADPLGLKGCEVKEGDSDDHDIILEISRAEYPETTGHIQDAINAGHPSIITIDRDGSKQNRKDSLFGIPTQKGSDRDEWPMAMFKEGGSGASVEYISPGDNRGAGSSIGSALSGYDNGTVVKVKIVD
ncbi:RHS repeat-associated core domain-containing protein [Chania multitudinisentens]|uniref:RHS repeat-associated core domain-containing protein n=1 Tax=Chania multitudinisentens TaxID=1639108 RepID=UPI0003E14E9F|nr:RHS repeat-associated core domain-containing protein [Chania multitudinisentens]